MTYVAPARQVFTQAHVIDTARTSIDKRSRGWTVCGEEMRDEDVWIDYQPTTADPVCGRCTGAVEHEQEMLL